jgi:hypothetical protein
MKPTRFEIETQIECPVSRVVEAMTNPENFRYWMSYLDKFEALEGTPMEAGALARLHYSRRGRTYVMEDKLVHCEPGKKYVSEVSGDAIAARIETVLEQDEDKTLYRISWSGKAQSFPMCILLPLFRRNLIKQSEQELEKFKQLVEERGSDFSQSME